MTMFTASELKGLTELLNRAPNQDKAITLDELHGFLFGLAIIPEMLVPSQWIPGSSAESVGKIAHEAVQTPLPGAWFV